MQPKFIATEIAVGPQLTPDQIGELAAAGFRSIIVNRPEGESADQPSFEETRRLAARHGMQVRFIPIAPGKQTPADVKAFGEAMAELPKPVYAHCRTGTRSATLWALSQSGRMPTSDILQKTKDAGYDVSNAL